MRLWALVLAITLWAATSTVTSSTAHAQTLGGLIGYGQMGIVVDGNIVYPNTVDAGAYDPAMDLLWFVTGDQLRVMDLRTADHATTLIAERWPDIGAFAVTGTSVAEWLNDRSGLRYPILAWGKSPKIKASPGKARFLSKAEDKAAKKAIKKIKLASTGKKWLKANRKRKAGTGKRTGAAVKEKVVMPAELTHCDDPKLCGQAYQLIADFQLVVVSGGELPVVCVLYDPSGGEFADPSPEGSGAWGDVNNPKLKGSSCFGYNVDSTGQSYVNGNDVCYVTKQGITCQTDPTWTYVGWVSESIASR